jgi:carboxylesterase
MMDENDVLQLKRPFSLGPTRARRGALLVHGFAGTPFTMSLLGRYLAERGFAIEAPCLAGHGLDTAALAHSGWRDWFGSVEESFHALRQRADELFVCGLSLGGLLTFELARGQPDIAAIAVLAAPHHLSKASERAVALARFPLMQHLAVPRIGGADIRDEEMRRKNNLAQGGSWMSFRAVVSLADLQARMREGVAEVKQPTLLLHSRGDHVVPFGSMAAWAAKIASKSVRQIALERSFHVLTLDVDREEVFRHVERHFLSHSRGGQSDVSLRTLD